MCQASATTLKCKDSACCTSDVHAWPSVAPYAAVRLPRAPRDRYRRRLLLWLLVRAVAIAFRRPRGSAALIAIAAAALVVVLFNGLGLLADRHFMLPVAPAFILLAVGALLGKRADT